MKAQKFIVKFPISGFEDVENVYFSEVDDGALAFLSLEGKEIELLLLNPYKVREYSFEIPLNIQTLLEIKPNTKVKVFCVFVRDKDIGVRVNFLAPILLNCDNCTLAQALLNQKDYPNFGLAQSIKDYIKE